MGKEKARVLRPYVAASGLKLLPRYRRLLSPDLAIEVVSPSDTVIRFKAKVDAYLQGGSNTVWVVFPESRSVTIYSGGSLRELKGDQMIEDALLPGFSAPVSSFFDLK